MAGMRFREASERGQGMEACSAVGGRAYGRARRGLTRQTVGGGRRAAWGSHEKERERAYVSDMSSDAPGREFCEGRVCAGVRLVRTGPLAPFSRRELWPTKREGDNRGGPRLKAPARAVNPK